MVSLARDCSPMAEVICCTIDEVRWAASATCLELRLCSSVARAISATLELASRDELRILSRA